LFLILGSIFACLWNTRSAIHHNLCRCVHSTRPRTGMFMTYLPSKGNQVDSAMSRRGKTRKPQLFGNAPGWRF